MNAFPGLQDCIGRIVQGASESATGASGEADLNAVVDQVQQVLLGPMMQNLRGSHPNAPDITPALTQILDEQGFSRRMDDDDPCQRIPRFERDRFRWKSGRIESNSQCRPNHGF